MAKKNIRIHDRDLGIGCDFVAEGKNEAEVIRVSTLHIRDEHPVEFQRVKQKMRNAIRTAPTGS